MTDTAISIANHLRSERPDRPLYCHRPRALTQSARHFVEAFPGRVHYAVKCNPDPRVLAALAAGGVDAVDAASLAEIETVRTHLPAARIAFMHPVKRRSEIATAYHQHGVRHFALDHADELAKIVEETGGARDVMPMVRIATGGEGAAYAFGDKFGCDIDRAADLLAQARLQGLSVGIAFHVGSQCLDPAAFTRALEDVRKVMRRSPGRVAVIDVGGGFPVAYTGVTPPPLDAFISAIRDGVARLPLPRDVEIWGEPGRALVASGASIIARVLLRRGSRLYLSDGLFGTLADLRIEATPFPMRRWSLSARNDKALARFAIAGPTCDPADAVGRRFVLPADCQEGDWIEIGQTGAYSTAFQTAFNGYGAVDWIEVSDAPLMPTALPALALAAE